MSGSININGIEIAIVRKKIKNIHLHVRPDGSVYISAPKRTPEKDLVRFARNNIGWIASQKKKYANKPEKDYYIKNKPVLDRKIESLLPKWEQITGLSCTSWHSRYMTSRWGSCIPLKGRLCFNLQLMDFPEECLEYVILHELLHLRHPGHGPAFKRDLSSYMPEWRTYSSLLR